MAVNVAEQVVTYPRRAPVSAGDPILEAKITTPGVPGWAVPRPRITKLIARGTRWYPLTVITGPPGAGKTMAAAAWAAEEPGPVAWVSLDEYDNRPGVFWCHVVAALRRSGLTVPGELDLVPRGRAGEHSFLLRLAAVLADQDPPVTLVLDDLHLLTDARLMAGLDFVVRSTGSGMRLVACSRMDPLLPLHRYRVADRLAEIRASDLAFSTAEAVLLLSQQGCTLPRDAVERLTRRTEGWAAGLRLAAMSLDAHPDPDVFINQLIAEDSALTGYLVEEVLNAAPPEVREVLLSTSILGQVNAEIAGELAGSDQAAGIMLAVAHANKFVQAIGGGWYRYHPLFAEMLRLKLRWQDPGRIACLHRRAASWCERNGQLTDAVRHAVQAGDWYLAASMVIDGLAIGELLASSTGSLAGEFQDMPHDETWTAPEPYLVGAAVVLSAGRPGPAASALAAADGILERLPAGEKSAGRLAAALIRLAISRRAGDLAAATAAAVDADGLLSRMPGEVVARRPGIRACVLSGRGAVELWSGHLDEAARLLEAGAAAAAASGAEDEQADCLGQLAVAEALRGRLCHAAELGAPAEAFPADGRRARTQRPNPAALVALAWVHLERNELGEARSLLKQVDGVLAGGPDKLTGAVACLVAAHAGLAAGRADLAQQFVARARSGWSVPSWLDHRLTLAEARASVAAGDAPAALAAAERAGHDDLPEAAVLHAQAWATAGDAGKARDALAPALASQTGTPDRVRLQAWLVDAQLSYRDGDHARGHRSLATALRLAQREQFRLPFALERGWMGPVLRHDPELARAYQQLAARPSRRHQPPARSRAPDPAATPVLLEPLTKREQEVLRHLSGMLSTAEVASEMYLSVNTVKTHIKTILRKLAATHRGEAVRRARQLELI